jgi:DNA-binding CsgD family transcriptional regulator
VETGSTAQSLYGRERELGQIQQFLERAATTPAALVLEGAPGVGKTTLWRAAVEAAADRGSGVLHAQPTEAESELSFSALGDLLEPALGRLERLSAPRRRALEVALLLVSDDRGAPDKRAVGLATRDLLRVLAADGPLVIAVDDAQWLDPASAGTLAYAWRRLGPEAVGMLIACRPGGHAPAWGEPQRIVVGPLSLGALHELLRNRAGASLTRPTVVRVHETSDGNPFFALELVRALAGREVLPGEPLPMPATLRELTASRFEQLDPSTREVLLYIAALAHPTIDVATAAAGEPAGAAIKAAVAAGVVELDGLRLRFTHPLLASTLYGSASSDERARVHRRLADVVTDAEERGRHLGAAATTPDANVAAALDDAAAAARTRGAPAAAAELVEVAVRLTPGDDSASLVRRLQAAGEHHLASGSTTRARSLLEQALERAERGPMRARVAVQLAALLDTQDIAAELPLLALALREAEGDVRLRAEIHDRIAFALIEDTLGAQRHARIALRLAERTGDQQLIAETLASSISGDFWAGEGIDHDVIGRGIELEERLPALSVGRSPTSMYAFALKWSGDVERARPLYERLRARGHATGDPGVVDILFYSAFHELISEDWEQAALHGEESRRLAVDFERETEVAAALWVGAWVAAYRGEVERARTTAAQAHRLAHATGLPDLILSGPPLGVLELSLANPAQALAVLRPLMQENRAKGTKEPGLLLGFPEHVEAAVACGELDEASELLDFVEEHAQRLDRAWALACSARGRALLATAQGDVAAAERAFVVAYEHHARRPQQLPTYELARTLLVHGSILRRQQQKRRAREALEQASAIFDRLGARVYAERTHSELARIGGRAAAAGENLSETERQIADLVAEGRTNREVAAALSLSPKTVEWNLSKVYAKLGVRSRAELASRRR